MATTTGDFERRGFVLRPLHLIGIAIILLAIVTGYFGLQSAFRPYTTSVAEASPSMHTCASTSREIASIRVTTSA